MLLYLALFTSIAAQETEDDGPPTPPTLAGESFKITVIEAEGFVERNSDGDYLGYIVDMIASVAEKAQFEYELLPPSGYGTACNPPLTAAADDATYDPTYASQYLCGQADVLGQGLIPGEHETDMYWSMYYVTNPRQLLGKFSVPFKPPFQGLTMYGTQTGVGNFNELIENQKKDKVGPACVAGNTAYAIWLADALPDLQTVEIENTHAASDKALRDGTCTVIINAEHVARHFVKYRYATSFCSIDGKPVGIIGEGLKYGLTQMAVGFSENTPEATVRAISYWMNSMMTCAPNNPDCSGSFYASWVESVGDSSQCGYVSDIEVAVPPYVSDPVATVPPSSGAVAARYMTGFAIAASVFALNFVN